MIEQWTAPGSHTVRVYESESSGHRTIAEFFASGVEQGDCCVMLSRPETFDAVRTLLAAGGSDGGQILFFDADAALAQFMEDRVPNTERTVGFFTDVLTQARARKPHGTIRAYGETSDMLCQRGQYAAALQLEELSGMAFGIDPQLSILCAYSMDRFRGDANVRHLRGICRAHQRVIPAENSTSMVNGPAGATDAGQPALPESAAKPSQTAPDNDSAGQIIYVIDDDASVRRSLARLLALLKWQVQAFDSAEVFLAEQDRLPPGGIILDMQLAGMSGLDLLRQMSDAGALWPVIAMSGSQDKETEMEALRLGARRFLHKPFDTEVLLDTIARTL